MPTEVSELETSVSDHPERPGGVTQLLQKWARGDENAARDLFRATYERLSSIAARHMQGESRGHSLEVEGLVHESYLRLMRAGEIAWSDRHHFFCVVSNHMRRILVEHARRRRAKKRGGASGAREVEVNPRFDMGQRTDVERVHAALDRLRDFSAEHAQLVLLSYFGGFTNAEISLIVEVSTSTVERRLAFARMWMRAQIPEIADPKACPH